MQALPVEGRSLDEVVGLLRELRSMDAVRDPRRFFSYLYETGVEELRRAALEAYRLFMDTNALDPTVFRSALAIERDLVGFAGSLASAGEDVVGTVTMGGTESIMLAVRAARYLYVKRHGFSARPGRVLAPLTVHPSVRKAADYLGLRFEALPVDPASKRLDTESLAESLGNDVAVVVVSAPNYPFGTIDPVKPVAELASERGVPVHVDACIGGFILPFLRELGDSIGPYDFRVEGVSSMSMDLHKYGYAPKGASVVLFRGTELKKGSLFVDLRWPGYVFVNTTVLSSRSVAPMAAAWAITRLLGYRGYLELAGRLRSARDRILQGLRGMGFKLLAPVESPILALSLEDDDDVLRFHANISKRGWVVGLQPRVKGVAPANIHLTVAPAHSEVAEEFLRDSEAALQEPWPEELLAARSLLERDPFELASMIGKTPYDSVIIAWLLSMMPPDVAEELAGDLVVEVYRG